MPARQRKGSGRIHIMPNVIKFLLSCKTGMSEQFKNCSLFFKKKKKKVNCSNFFKVCERVRRGEQFG